MCQEIISHAQTPYGGPVELEFDSYDVPSLLRLFFGVSWNSLDTSPGLCNGEITWRSLEPTMPVWNKAWRFACFFRWSLRMNRFSHMGHLKFFSPEKYSLKMCCNEVKIKSIRWISSTLKYEYIKLT